ncbi:MAG: hypothetical protein LBF89_11405 [Bacteroidales bacterium]|jgi:hypothetical protein|nr:hypothetical protein [Bacteroidales bacterium]
MELEELKERWILFDNRMQRQEGLKIAIIKDMLLTKSDKALSRLINYDYFGLVACLVVLPVLLLVWTLSPAFVNKVIVSAGFVFVVAGMISEIVELIKLHKVDFSLPVSRNICMVQKINIVNRRSYIIYCIIAFVLLIFVLAYLLMTSANVVRIFVIAIAIPLSIILAFWEYKRLYRRNFNSILLSLQELKELEEPDNNAP